MLHAERFDTVSPGSGPAGKLLARVRRGMPAEHRCCGGTCPKCLPSKNEPRRAKAWRSWIDVLRSAEIVGVRGNCGVHVSLAVAAPRAGKIDESDNLAVVGRVPNRAAMAPRDSYGARWPQLTAGDEHAFGFGPSADTRAASQWRVSVAGFGIEKTMSRSPRGDSRCLGRA